MMHGQKNIKIWGS